MARQETQRWAVGIGRPIAQQSLIDFMTAFAHVMPPQVKFLPREIPGVSYLAADASRMKPLASLVVASLCDGNRLNGPTALAPVSISINKFRLDHRTGATSPLHAQLIDRVYTYYPRGYLLAGEKAATKDEGLPPIENRPTTDRVPTSILKLGSVAGDLKLVTIPLLEEVSQLMQGQLELQPVGPVSSSLLS